MHGLGLWEFPTIRGTLLWGPYNKDPTIQGNILAIFGNSHFSVGGLGVALRGAAASGSSENEGTFCGLGFRGLNSDIIVFATALTLDSRRNIWQFLKIGDPNTVP